MNPLIIGWGIAIVLVAVVVFLFLSKHPAMKSSTSSTSPSGWATAIATTIVMVVAFGMLAFAFGDCEWLTEKVPHQWPWTWIVNLGSLTTPINKFLIFGTLAAGYLILWSTDLVKSLSLGTTPFWILILIGFIGELLFRVIYPWATRLP